MTPAVYLRRSAAAPPTHTNGSGIVPTRSRHTAASKLAPSAQYWIGNAHYAQRDFKQAVVAQQRVLTQWLPAMHALRQKDKTHRAVLRWAVDVDPLAI